MSKQESYEKGSESQVEGTAKSNLSNCSRVLRALLYGAIWCASQNLIPDSCHCAAEIVYFDWGVSGMCRKERSLER